MIWPLILPFVILYLIIILINRKPKQKRLIDIKIKVGDYVTTDLPNLKIEFDRFYRVESIRKVDWRNNDYDEGDALTIEDHSGEYWSKYFYKK